MPEIAFVGETFPHRSINVSAQDCLNLYPEVLGTPGTKSKYVLIGTPGGNLFSDLSSLAEFGCRGLYYTSTSVLYALFDETLFRVNSDGSIAETFTISGGSSRVYFADNGKYLMFVDGAVMWRLEMDTGDLGTVDDLDFTNPVQIEYIQQRFVSFGRDSNQFYWSEVGPDGPLSWPALNTASSEGSADDIIAIATTDGELVTFGPRSFEVFRVVGDVRLPFSRVNGSFTNIGCGAPDSVAEIGGKIYWLGSSNSGKNQVFMLDGYNPVVISNPAISNLLDVADTTVQVDRPDILNTTSDAVGFAYQQESHVFYVLNLRQANKTLVYDLTTDQWHRRSTRDAKLNRDNRWDPLYAVFAYDRVITGHSSQPKLIELDLNTYTEWDGTLIKRKRVSPVYFDQEYKYLFHKWLQIDLETGVGLTPLIQGNDPQAMLRWSDDSGHTWSSERWTTLGKVGKYKTRARWNKLGRAYNRVYELTITDPVKVIILGAALGFTEGVKR